MSGEDLAELTKSAEMLLKLKDGSTLRRIELSDALTMLGLRAWAKNGFNTLVLSEDLVRALLLTEINSESSSNFPFEAYLIQVPEGVVKIGDSHVTHMELMSDSENKAAISFLAGHAPVRNTHRLNVMLYNPTKNWWQNLSLEFRPSSLPEGPGDFYALNDIASQLNSQETMTAIRLVLNLNTFINSKIETLEEADPGRRLRLASMRKIVPKIFMVGNTVKLSRELRDVSIRYDSPSVLKIQHRYIVRGHWRWQPIGEMLPEGHEGPRNAKRLWIQPHWKGPEGAEAWRHIYEVDQSAVGASL